MFDNRACAGGLALLAVLRIGQRMLHRGLCNADPLHANPQTCIVHHGKHRGHPAIFGTNEPAGCA